MEPNSVCRLKWGSPGKAGERLLAPPQAGCDLPSVPLMCCLNKVGNTLPANNENICNCICKFPERTEGSCPRKMQTRDQILLCSSSWDGT